MNTPVVRLLFYFLLSFIFWFRFVLYKTVGRALLQIRTPRLVGMSLPEEVHSMADDMEEKTGSLVLGVVSQERQFLAGHFIKRPSISNFPRGSRNICFSPIQAELKFLDTLTA